MFIYSSWTSVFNSDARFSVRFKSVDRDRHSVFLEQFLDSLLESLSIVKSEPCDRGNHVLCWNILVLYQVLFPYMLFPFGTDHVHNLKRFILDSSDHNTECQLYFHWQVVIFRHFVRVFQERFLSYSAVKQLAVMKVSFNSWFWNSTTTRISCAILKLWPFFSPSSTSLLWGRDSVLMGQIPGKKTTPSDPWNFVAITVVNYTLNCLCIFCCILMIFLNCLCIFFFFNLCWICV